MKFCKCPCNQLMPENSKQSVIYGHTKNLVQNICECGICGQLCTNRFVKGHASRINPHLWMVGKPAWSSGKTKETEPRLNYIPYTEEQKASFPNICQCGCGEKCKNRFVNRHSQRGVPMTNKVKAALSIANSGRTRGPSWNAGLTKKEHPELKFGSFPVGYKHSEESLKKMRGHTPWNKGKTKEQEISLVHSRESIRKNKAGVIKAYKDRGDEIVAKIMLHSGKKRFPCVKFDGSIIKMRSNWEVLYAHYLDSLGILWQYEPKQFKLSNGKRYYPDFYLPELKEWHEVKGYLTPEAQEKMDLFQNEYPDEKLVIVRNVAFSVVPSGKMGGE